MHPLPNGEELRDIEHSMNMALARGYLIHYDTLLQILTAVSLQNATVFTTCDGFFTKCDVITKCDSISVKLVNK